MNNQNLQYTVALTSCGRFDLLRRTVESLLRHADAAPAKFIIAEDSGDEKVRDVLADLDFPFEFMINRPALGQIRAVDAAYAKIETPFVFHCQDDWEFFRAGFVTESFALLNEFPKVSAVMLRGRDERKELRKLPSEELNGVRFFRARPELHWYFFGYGFNPGMRRLSDWQKIAPFSAVGREREISFVFKRRGFYTAHLEIPAVCHIGWGRSTIGHGGTTFGKRAAKKINTCRSKANLLKWRVFGLPAKWRDGSC